MLDQKSKKNEDFGFGVVFQTGPNLKNTLWKKKIN